MKINKALFAATLLSSAIAMAYPAIGDKSEFTGNVVFGDGTQMDVTASGEVLSAGAEAGSWRVHKMAKVGTSEVTKTEDTKKIFTKEMYEKIMGECEEKGGVLEEVTVPAGTYSTCMMTKGKVDPEHFLSLKSIVALGCDDDDDDEDDHDGVTSVWIGDVPFGLVKVTRTLLSAEENHHPAYNGTLELAKSTNGPVQAPENPENPENPDVPEVPENPEVPQ